jgi:hypothetical protein
MVVMGVDGIRVDLLSLHDFHDHLAPRRQEAEAALAALVDAHRSPRGNTPRAQRPELGQFHDAELTAGHYDALREDYLVRLRRLISAVAAAQNATAVALRTYRTVEALNESTTRAVADLLHDRATGDGPPRGR